MKKKFLLSIAIVFLILIAILAIFLYRMYAKIQAQYSAIHPVLLENIPDGVYRGNAGEFLVSVELEVSVVDHQITEVRILHQICGSNYKALDTVTRILKEQSILVDTVSGATTSSRSIMAAVYAALNAGS